MKTNEKRIINFISCLLAFLLLIAFSILAQEETAVPETPIAVSKILKDSLATGETHAYTLELKPDQFVYGEVNQISVDVVITIKDPGGKILATIDGPALGP